MKVIFPQNVNGALILGLEYLRNEGLEEPSRNGPVLVAPGPFTTVYGKPWQRVLFNPVRDANPFFHYAESMWMLAGRNDAAYPGYFAGQIKEYADKDGTLGGAYGHRWRVHFGYDQVDMIIKQLRADPSTRRCVLAMWDGNKDLFSGGQPDIPCNTHCYFRVNGNHLFMQVNCRSNDAVWGAHGANAVHFSILQEYIAAAVGAHIGTMTQVSFNYHAYKDRPDVVRLTSAALDSWVGTDGYHMCAAYEMFPNREAFDKELAQYFTHRADDKVLYLGGSSPAVTTLLLMENAYRAHKAGDTQGAMEIASRIPFEDWRLGCGMWLERRLK